MYKVHVSVYAKTIFNYVNTKFYIKNIINVYRCSFLQMSSRMIINIKVHVTIKFL
jgi:hypothetical protein